MKLPPAALVVVSAGLCLATGSVRAAVLTLQPTADAYVKNSTVSTNYGADVNLIANNANGVRVFFLRFDLSGVIDPISNIKLELTSSLAGTAESFNVYGLASGSQESWTEGGVTWANAPGVINAFVTSGGTLAQTLDTADLYNSGQILASFTNATAAGSTDQFFDVSSGPVFSFLSADADRVVTFVIAEQDPSDNPGIGWASKEATGTKPVLTVTTVPEPGSLALAACGAIAALGTRRRHARR